MSRAHARSEKTAALERESKSLGEYLLMEVIGQGQFGVVYKALSRSHGNFVAVKKLAHEPERMGTLMVCCSLTPHQQHTLAPLHAQQTPLHTTNRTR